jgi:hypothetical protein
VKPRPNVPTPKAPTASAFRTGDNRLLLVGGERLAAPLLPQRAARTKTHVEVVKDLGAFVDHALSV